MLNQLANVCTRVAPLLVQKLHLVQHPVALLAHIHQKPPNSSNSPTEKPVSADTASARNSSIPRPSLSESAIPTTSCRRSRTRADAAGPTLASLLHPTQQLDHSRNCLRRRSQSRLQLQPRLRVQKHNTITSQPRAPPYSATSAMLAGQLPVPPESPLTAPTPARSGISRHRHSSLPRFDRTYSDTITATISAVNQAITASPISTPLHRARAKRPSPTGRWTPVTRFPAQPDRHRSAQTPETPQPSQTRTGRRTPPMPQPKTPSCTQGTPATGF
jgi:hypothetical protein